MKNLPLIEVLCFVILTISCSAVDPAPEEPQPLKDLSGKTVLFVYGGWEGHNPVACRDLYVPWLQQQGANVITSDNLEIYTDSAVTQSADLIVQIWTMGQITGPQLNGLLDAVRNGAGIAGWHGGIVDAFLQAHQYHLMTGAQFLAHPGGIIPFTVNVTAPEDEIMQDVHDFTMQTEQYYMLTDPNIEVLATTRFSGNHLSWIEGRTMPVIWKNQYGSGRVFVTTLGHNMSDHAVSEFETTLKRGMLWACR